MSRVKAKRSRTSGDSASRHHDKSLDISLFLGAHRLRHRPVHRVRWVIRKDRAIMTLRLKPSHRLKRGMYAVLDLSGTASESILNVPSSSILWNRPCLKGYSKDQIQRYARAAFRRMKLLRKRRLQ